MLVQNVQRKFPVWVLEFWVICFVFRSFYIKSKLISQSVTLSCGLFIEKCGLRSADAIQTTRSTCCLPWNSCDIRRRSSELEVYLMPCFSKMTIMYALLQYTCISSTFGRKSVARNGFNDIDFLYDGKILAIRSCFLPIWQFFTVCTQFRPYFYFRFKIWRHIWIQRIRFYPNVTTLRSGLCYRNSVCRLSVCLSSVVCLSVTLVHPTQGVEPFGKISSPLCTLAILWPPCKILRR